MELFVCVHLPILLINKIGHYCFSIDKIKNKINKLKQKTNKQTNKQSRI